MNRLLGWAIGWGLTVAAWASAKEMFVYFGTYNSHGSKGIYSAKMDPDTGQLSEPKLAALAKNASFLAIAPDGRHLYCVLEIDDFGDKPSGGIGAFRINQHGKLNLINAVPTAGGSPCHLIVDAKGRHVLAANYGGGSVCAIAIDEDGSLGARTAFVQHTGSSVNKQRQEGPHAHSIQLDAQNRFAVAADLGLDQLLVYRYDAAKGSLVPNDPPFTKLAPGSGPRHFAFHPNGRLACVNHEIASAITSLRYDPDAGRLEPIQTASTLPAKFSGENTTAEIRIHPNGRFVYCSNRGHDSIAVFSIDPGSGKLTPLGQTPTGGKVPRNFGIDPAGRFMLAANQDSDNVVVFRIDETSGRLTPTGQKVPVPMPVCVRFLERN